MPQRLLKFVPPGGFRGFQDQTIAAQQQIANKIGSVARSASGGGRKRRKKAKPARAVKRRASRRGGKFTKGSAAAKRHMAKLRRMRKK